MLPCCWRLCGSWLDRPVGLSVVDSATLVVNTLKVIQTLEKIGEQLQVRLQD